MSWVEARFPEFPVQGGHELRLIEASNRRRVRGTELPIGTVGLSDGNGWPNDRLGEAEASGN